MLYHQTDHGKLFLVNNLIKLRSYRDNQFDIAIADPPYGIGEDGAKNHSRGAKTGFKGQKRQAKYEATKYTPKDWDKSIPSEEYFYHLRRVSKNQIIFGGNYFQSVTWNYGNEDFPDIRTVLGATNAWVVWDKDNGGNDFADAELAWTSFNSAVRICKYRWNGMLQGNMKRKENRFHPTQKPVYVYRWLLRKYAKKGMSILDPNSGSCSSLIACITEGMKYEGLEIDYEYFIKGSIRIENQRYGATSSHKDTAEEATFKQGHQGGLFC